MVNTFHYEHVSVHLTCFTVNIFHTYGIGMMLCACMVTASILKTMTKNYVIFFLLGFSDFLSLKRINTLCCSQAHAAFHQVKVCYISSGISSFNGAFMHCLGQPNQTLNTAIALRCAPKYAPWRGDLWLPNSDAVQPGSWLNHSMTKLSGVSSRKGLYPNSTRQIH